MPLNSTDKSNNTFSIDHIPGADPIILKHGHVLEAGKRNVAGIFNNNVDSVGTMRAIGLSIQALRNAGYKCQLPKKLWTMWSLKNEDKGIPHDREYIRLRDEKVCNFVEDLLDRLITPESSVHGLEHLCNAAEKNREGQPVIQMGNHGSEMDPVICNVLLRREHDTVLPQDPTTAATIAEVRSKLLAVMGHKIMLEKFRRIFSSAVHSLFTIASKYRTNLPDEKKSIASAYVDNVNTILKELIINPEYFVMLFPEGGRTRNNTIGMEITTIQAAMGKIILPTLIQTPEDFLAVEKGGQSFKPETVNVYYGEPFTPTKGLLRSRANKRFVQTFRDNLGKAGAPVDEYAWGYMQSEKGVRNQSRTQKFIEVS